MKLKFFADSAKILITKILIFALTIFLLTAFSWTIFETGSFFTFSMIVVLFYAVALFLGGHDKGCRDGKKGSLTPPYPLKGFLLAGTSELINFILLIILFLLQGRPAFWKANLLFCIWNVPFFGFLGVNPKSVSKFSSVLTMNTEYILPVIIIIISYGLGYICGYKFPDMFEQIASMLTYKNKKVQE